MMSPFVARRRLIGASLLALAATAQAPAFAAGAAAAPAAPVADQTRPPSDIAEGSDIVVTATRANEVAPVTASLQTTQPQSVISRSFIEDSLPATADFNEIALISPSVSNFGGVNGPGLSESKAQIRGFQDGEYNITYDGVPFGDTNDPTHHSNTFFPSNTIETLVIDRGPGNASQLGQATFGGNINLFSRATRADMGAEAKVSYGSFGTDLERVLLQSGAISALGGTEIVASGQRINSNGARTFSPFRSYNGFGKATIPIGPDVTLSILGTYNENRFNQPDKDGATRAQIAQFGKQFSLTDDPTSQTYYGYNKTHKTTDFEIAKLEARLAPWATFTNRAYTYSYDNETLSGNDVTLFATATPAAIAAANVVTLTPGAKAVAGIPGYTKTNKYRVYGDIAQGSFDFGFAALTVGAWLEHSNTYRQQRDVNLLTLAPNYIEKAVKDPVTGLATPQNIKFDQNSNINHTEEFAELALKPLPGLTITPGVKHVDFNRRITATYNQTTRYPQSLSNTYTATLPFLTANYAITERLSVYGQYAKGFLAPPLSVLYVANPTFSTVVPERSTNYQAGAVYHGAHLSLDADAYLIRFRNKFAQDTSAPASEGTVFFNQGAVTYKGVEGQATYAFENGLAIFANGSRNYANTDNPGSPHTQVANAPVFTAAGGVLFKHGPMRFSLIDKYTGHQWGSDGENPLYRIPGYNTAILSARYRFRFVTVGVQVDDLFGSERLTNINAGKTTTFDQLFYQPGRSITGDVTVTF